MYLFQLTALEVYQHAFWHEPYAVSSCSRLWKDKGVSRLRRKDRQEQITFRQRHGHVISLLGERTHWHDLALINSWGLCSMSQTLATRSHWPPYYDINKLSFNITFDGDKQFKAHNLFLKILNYQTKVVCNWLHKDYESEACLLVPHLFTTCKVLILPPALL